MRHGILVVSCNSGAPCQDGTSNRFTRGIGKAKNKFQKGNVGERAERRCELGVSRGRSAEELLGTPAVPRGKAVHVSDAALVQTPGVKTFEWTPHSSLPLSGRKLELNRRRDPLTGLLFQRQVVMQLTIISLS
jgi:hypothetical protein